MKLIKLNFADIHRDGGSCQASFQTDDDLTYNLWLERSRMPDGEGLHHRWPFEYVGSERPRSCLPVITGSVEDTAILDRLNQFLATSGGMTSSVDRTDLVRLQELVHYIKRREYCLPADLLSWQPDVE
jgi:hypothetical protein